jgi:hypothetical protein
MLGRDMMKKIKSINKQLIFVLIFSLSFFIFAGCQNKSAANNTQGNATSNRSFNTAAMKKKMQDSINPLVTNKTITQDQANKIVAALIPANTQKNGGQRNYQSQQNGQSNGQQNGQTNGVQGARTNRQSTELTKLVTDKVITQAQANAVSQAIKTNTTRPQNSQVSGT